MVRNLSFVSVSQGIGKTAIALAFGLSAEEQGKEVGYMKPLGTRLRSRFGKLLDEDSLLAKEVLNLEEESQEISPIIYSQTFIEQVIKGQENPEKLRGRIREKYEDLAENRDLMIIEGGGKLNTGGVVNLTDFDIVELFNADVILVARFNSPEDLDDIICGAKRFGEHLEGVIFNEVTEMNFDKVESMAIPFLESQDIPVLGVLPRKKELAGITVKELSEELGAQELSSITEDVFIERFLVGAMTGESALKYLRRTKEVAFITGGDRPDIQRAALESPGVNCLILTGGFRPPGAIIGKAEEKGIPILLVQSDTMTAVENAEDVTRKGRTRREESVNIMYNLLSDNIDLGSILSSE